MDDRIARLEADAHHLLDEIEAFRALWESREQNDHVRQQNTEMRQAIIRYAVACAQVDLQKAMLQARNEGRDLLLESLKGSLDEEEVASRELRDMAKRLQAESRTSEINAPGISPPSA